MASSNWDVLITTRELDEIRDAKYDEGYKAGRIAALREVGCLRRTYAGVFGGCLPRCTVCRLLAESEQGEVGGDR